MIARYLLILLLAGTLVVPASPSLSQEPGGIGIKLVEAPTSRADDPRARIYLVDHLAPGASISRAVEVANTTTDEHVVELYLGGARIAGGEFGVLPDREGNELTSWGSITPDRVVVGPGSSVRADLTIEVPSDAQPGERYGVVWAEAPSATSSGVTVVNRVGIRMYVSVGEGAEPPTDFTIDSLTASRTGEGVPVVRARIENTGGRAVDLVGQLSLTEGPAGLSAGPFDAEPGTTLAPGSQGTMTVLLDPDIPSGPWLARMVARSGTVEKAVEATIVFPEGAGGSSEPVEAEEVPLHQDRGVLIPLATGLVILMLVLLALFWFYRRRRRDEQDEEETDDQPRSTVPLPRG